MNAGPPILEGQPPSDAQERLLALFDALERGQLEFLDQSGKRLVELSAGLLGVLFGVTAFGDKFPPPYLQDNDMIQGLVVAVLVLYLGAMLAALWALRPRRYPRYRHNLSEMQRVLAQIIAHKTLALWVAGAAFWLGSAALALLVGILVLGA